MTHFMWKPWRALASGALATLLVGHTCQTALAAGTWTGGTDSAWNNAANWNTNPALPTGDLTINNTAGPGVYPLIDASSLFTPEDIHIGNTTTGRLDHTAGTLAQTFLTGFAQGAGSLNAGKL